MLKKEELQEYLLTCNKMIAELKERLQSATKNFNKEVEPENLNEMNLYALRQTISLLQELSVDLQQWYLTKGIYEAFLKEMNDDENQQ